MVDPTCLSYWFPKIAAAGIPVPRTEIVLAPREALQEIYGLLGGEEPGGAAAPFYDEIRRAAGEVGYPAFLRTGMTSGKHEWSRTCYLDAPDAVVPRVVSLVEFSELVDMLGLACDVWAVREMLPTMPIGICTRYRGMPICREFRFFVEDDQILCWHPYWPEGALRDGAPEFRSTFDYDEFCRIDDAGPLRKIASTAGKAVGGAWSVDLLETENGWYLTDMAEADKSFHWESCPHALDRT